MQSCQICQSTQLRTLIAQEEMYGTWESFEYRQCQQCQCLQLLSPPPDLSPYYPKDYYSFRSPVQRLTLKRWRRGLKRSWLLSHPNWLSGFMKRWLADYSMFWIYRSLGVNRASHCLDVGCGSGEHVLELRDAGVLHSMGIDPHTAQDIDLNDRPFVRKAVLKDLTADAHRFDLITFHHSLEHMPNQLEALTHAAILLRTGGKILVRIPTVTSDAFEQYQEKWCQLDAPRHLYLHSHKSIAHVASAAGLKVERMWCDSSEVQFIASEQYRQGITLFDPRSYTQNRKTLLFNSDQIQRFKAQTVTANQQMRGDQICVVLSKTNP